MCETFQKWGLLFKERICSHREQILPLKRNPNEKGDNFMWKLLPFEVYLFSITFTTLWANSADDKLVIFFLIFPRKQAFACHANCLPWHVIANLVAKIRKLFQIVVCWNFHPACLALRSKKRKEFTCDIYMWIWQFPIRCDYMFHQTAPYNLFQVFHVITSCRTWMI